ncbi:MAG TPA: helix-turn-helix transcriptional regulator [Clostridiaceae bacterium]|nr:helix-turn-helix transcriptional regulator [Clostridiaceae bacterium]
MEILSLGEKIKRRRKDFDMTLKELAAERITPGQISLVESGKSNPSMDLLEYLADALDTTVEYLMESEASQAEKVCTYYENIAEAYILNGDYSLGEENVERALYYAEKYSLEYRKARNLYLRALIHMAKKENTAAQQLFLSANVIYIRNNNFEETVNTFLNLGKITIEMKAYNSACNYFQQAEKIYLTHSIGNDFLLGEIYYYISLVLFKMDNIDGSIKYSYLAKEKFLQLEDKTEYGKTLMLLAEEHNKNGNLESAIKYSKKTLGIFEELKEYSYLAVIENNLGKLFYEFDNIDESFIHYNKAKEIRILSNDERIVDTLINICGNYIKLKDVPKAEASLKEVLESIQEDDYISMKEYYMLKHKIDLLKNDEKSAEKTLLIALSYVSNLGLDKETAEISIMIGKFYIDRGKEKIAATYLNSGVDAFKKMGIIK